MELYGLYYLGLGCFRGVRWWKGVCITGMSGDGVSQAYVVMGLYHKFKMGLIRHINWDGDAKGVLKGIYQEYDWGWD